MIVLSDQSLSHRLETVRPTRPLDSIEVDDRATARTATARQRRPTGATRSTDDGVSPMAVPGGAGRVRLDRHRARRGGQPALRAGAARGDDGQALPQARPARSRDGRITTSGPEQADVGILGWGSTEGAAVEAAEICLDRGHARSRPAIRACWRRCRSSGSRDWAAGHGADRGAGAERHRPVRAAGALGRRHRGRVGAARRSGLPFTAAQIADFMTDGTPPVDRTGGAREPRRGGRRWLTS